MTFWWWKLSSNLKTLMQFSNSCTTFIENTFLISTQSTETAFELYLSGLKTLEVVWMKMVNYAQRLMGRRNADLKGTKANTDNLPSQRRVPRKLDLSDWGQHRAAPQRTVPASTQPFEQDVDSERYLPCKYKWLLKTKSQQNFFFLIVSRNVLKYNWQLPPL